MIEWRVGTFEIHRELIWNAKMEELQKVFLGMVILETQFDMFRNVIVYTAISPHFELIEQREMPGKYRCTVNSKRIGNKEIITGVTWERYE